MISKTFINLNKAAEKKPAAAKSPSAQEEATPSSDAPNIIETHADSTVGEVPKLEGPAAGVSEV